MSVVKNSSDGHEIGHSSSRFPPRFPLPPPVSLGPGVSETGPDRGFESTEETLLQSRITPRGGTEGTSDDRSGLVTSRETDTQVVSVHTPGQCRHESERQGPRFVLGKPRKTFVD